MKKSTLLFILLVITVPAALVYVAAKMHADRQLQQHEESISREGRAAIAHVVKLNELRQTMPGKTPQELTALVSPPLPAGFTLRPLTDADRAAHPALKDSDYLVQQSAPPHLLIPSAAPPLHLDLSAAPPLHLDLSAAPPLHLDLSAASATTTTSTARASATAVTPEPSFTPASPPPQ